MLCYYATRVSTHMQYGWPSVSRTALSGRCQPPLRVLDKPHVKLALFYSHFARVVGREDVSSDKEVVSVQYLVS
jgi:hypothetical protein